MTKNWHAKGNYIYSQDDLAAVGKAFDDFYSTEQAVEHAELMAQAPALLARAEAAEDRAKVAEDRAEAAEQKLREIAQFTLKTNTRAEAAEAKAARLKKALDSLFDAHYGMSYHHCGDGDGLNPEEAAEIVALVKE